MDFKKTEKFRFLENKTLFLLHIKKIHELHIKGYIFGKNNLVVQVTFYYTSKALFVYKMFFLHFFLPLSVFLFREVDESKNLTFMMSLTVYRPKYIINLIKFAQYIFQKQYFFVKVFSEL